MKKKSILILIVTISVLVIVAVLLINKFNNKDTRIGKKLSGVRISKNSLEVLETLTANIDGYITKSSNGFGFSFTGDLQFSNLEFSKDSHGTLIYTNGFGEDGLIKRGIINYFRSILTDGVIYPDVATIQWVETDFNLSYLIITDYDGDLINDSPNNSIKEYNGNDILVFPATDIASALALIEEYQIDQKIFLETTMEDYK